MNACRCEQPQYGLYICHLGYYRCISSFAVSVISGALLEGQHVTSPDGRDESWISAYPPHAAPAGVRNGVVAPARSIVMGDSLVVHFSYTCQRMCPSWHGGEHPALLRLLEDAAVHYTGANQRQSAARRGTALHCLADVEYTAILR
eukprot:3342183-Prymnesium_polylepis.1